MAEQIIVTGKGLLWSRGAAGHWKPGGYADEGGKGVCMGYQQHFLSQAPD